MHLKLGEAEARIVRMGEAMRRSVPSTPTPMSPAHTPGSKQQQGQVDGRDVNPFGWGQADQQGRYSIASSSAEAGGVQGAGAVWQLQQRVAALSTECESLRQQLASARQEIAILVAAKSRPGERFNHMQCTCDVSDGRGIGRYNTRGLHMWSA